MGDGCVDSGAALGCGLPEVSLARVRLPKTPDPSTLTAEERSLYEGLPGGAHRRREWWAGRTAAREALAQLEIEGVSVLRDPEGRPVLHGPGAGAARIAIAHGKRLAVAAVVPVSAPMPHVGVDVVDPEDQPRLERIEARILRGPEPRILAAEPKDGLRIIWGTREAAAKATHTGMFAYGLTKLHVTAVDRAARRITTNRRGIEATWLELDSGELVVVAVADDDAVAEAGAQDPMRP